MDVTNVISLVLTAMLSVGVVCFVFGWVKHADHRAQCDVVRQEVGSWPSAAPEPQRYTPTWADSQRLYHPEVPVQPYHPLPPSASHLPGGYQLVGVYLVAPDGYQRVPAWEPPPVVQGRVVRELTAGWSS